MMKSQLECPHCGRANPMTQVYCRECGAKLDHRNVHFGPADGDRIAGGGRWWKAAYVVILVGLLAVAVLALWPARSGGAMGSDVSGKAYQFKLARIYDACVTGTPMQVTVTEEEINRYLRAMVDRLGEGDETAGVMQARLEEVRMALHRDGVVVTARIKWGPVPLVYGITGMPEKAPGAFRMRVDQARLGLLPVPPPLAEPLVISKVRRIFQDLKTETEVLRLAGALELASGKVRATTDAR